jgi:hypothetical protein
MSGRDVQSVGKALGQKSGAHGLGAGCPTTSSVCEEMMVIRPTTTLTYSTIDITSSVI